MSARFALVGAIVAMLATPSAGAQAPALPEGPGVAVARAACVSCHESDLIVSQRLSSPGWDREIAKMERWGAKVSADERGPLVAYLTSRWGPP